jgi:flagellar basal body-associated protein FliL
MDKQEPDSRYLILWVSVVLAAGIILVGWYFSVKYNFNKINTEMEQSVNKTQEQAEAEVQEMMEGVDQIIKESNEAAQEIIDIKVEEAVADEAAIVEPTEEK